MTEDNDPATAALKIAKAADGFTDADRAELVELAATISKRDFGSGIAKQPRGTVESLISLAIRERGDERAKRAAAPKWSDDVLKLKLAAKNTFGKRAVAEGNPAARRGDFIKAWGIETYNVQMKAWGCTTDVRVPGQNPDRGNKKLKRALRALNPIEEATDFNINMGRQTEKPRDAAKQKDRSGDAKSTYPYAWPQDHPGRIAAIAKVMGRMPTKFVAELARAASCSVSGYKLTR
jgi:hypothetical protein